MTDNAPRPETTATTRRIALVALGAFVFAFSMVPLYNIACEKVFGIKLQKGASAATPAAGRAVAIDRRVHVQFDGTVNSKLQWSFRPLQLALDVHPGQQYEALYVARNEANESIVGSAAPSIAPNQASGYFNKTECFCFTQQALKAGEERIMPVRFIIDRSLPADIATITLSYTFYRNDSATAALHAPGAVVAAVNAAP